jgi:Cu/Ag efflux pump CusA
MLSGTKANIAIKLFGDDLNKMFSLGNQIKGAISDIPGVADLNVEQQIERPQLKIQPKREMLLSSVLLCRSSRNCERSFGWKSDLAGL